MNGLLFGVAGMVVLMLALFFRSMLIELFAAKHRKKQNKGFTGFIVQHFRKGQIQSTEVIPAKKYPKHEPLPDLDVGNVLVCEWCGGEMRKLISPESVRQRTLERIGFALIMDDYCISEFLAGGITRQQLTERVKQIARRKGG